jgi:hypothetical protein
VVLAHDLTHLAPKSNVRATGESAAKRGFFGSRRGPARLRPGEIPKPESVAAPGSVRRRPPRELRPVAHAPPAFDGEASTPGIFPEGESFRMTSARVRLPTVLPKPPPFALFHAPSRARGAAKSERSHLNNRLELRVKRGSVRGAPEGVGVLPTKAGRAPPRPLRILRDRARLARRTYPVEEVKYPILKAFFLNLVKSPRALGVFTRYRQRHQSHQELLCNRN